ncbi:hypothetical protein ACERII_08360 [Evansella sp. AB-rgal1]|uniref:hypothetical protein n=1 Tax=Evansella sp. AB-rgal1 TaxID=3242696 RepID=UPI00359DE52D
MENESTLRSNLELAILYAMSVSQRDSSGRLASCRKEREQVERIEYKPRKLLILDSLTPLDNTYYQG